MRTGLVKAETFRESGLPSHQERAKSLFSAPWMFLTATSHKDKPTSMGYDLLRRMAKANVIALSIILTRVNQCAQFAKPQRTKYDMGYKVQLRNQRRSPDKSELEKIHQLEMMILNTSSVEKAFKREDFEVFLRKFVRDSMTIDQAAFEIINRRNKEPYEWYAVDAGTFRLALHARELQEPGDIESTSPIRWTKETIGKETLRSDSTYVQVWEDRVIEEFNELELGFLMRNVDSDINANGYGVSELEVLVHHVTAQLWQEQYNRNFFKQGSAIKGIINVPLNVPDDMLEGFKREWHSQVSGVNNSWRTPIIRTEKLNFTSLHQSNREMEWQAYSDYLIRCHGAIFCIDPYEFGFDIKTGTGPSQNAPLFESSNESKVKWSKDRGLKPLLSAIERTMNQNILWRIDPRFELVLTGLDSKTEEATVELKTKELGNYKTVDEVRAEENLPLLGPDKGGDLILNVQYTQFLSQKAMRDQQEQQQGGDGMAQGGDDEEEPLFLPPYLKRKYDEEKAQQAQEQQQEMMAQQQAQQQNGQQQGPPQNGPPQQGQPMQKADRPGIIINPWDLNDDRTEW